MHFINKKITFLIGGVFLKYLYTIYVSSIYHKHSSVLKHHFRVFTLLNRTCYYSMKGSFVSVLEMDDLRNSFSHIIYRASKVHLSIFASKISNCLLISSLYSCVAHLWFALDLSLLSKFQHFKQVFDIIFFSAQHRHLLLLRSGWCVGLIILF